MATVNLGRIKSVWRGTWATGTAYSRDDVVQEGVNSYICVTAHTAGATFAGDSANWELMVQGADLPTQSGQAGKVLQTDGSILSWGSSGNYSIHAFDEFSTNGQINGANGSYFKISNGNYVTFTPQSNNDIIFFNGVSQTYDAANSSGGGLHVRYGTANPLDAGNSSAVKYPGTHANYLGNTGDAYKTLRFNAMFPCTNLTVGAQYYAELVGSAHGSGTTTNFGYSVSGVAAEAVTFLQMIHYTRN